MITGTVTAYREAIIRLNVRGPGGEEKTVEAVVVITKLSKQRVP